MYPFWGIWTIETEKKAHMWVQTHLELSPSKLLTNVGDWMLSIFYCGHWPCLVHSIKNFKICLNKTLKKKCPYGKEPLYISPGSSNEVLILAYIANKPIQVQHCSWPWSALLTRWTLQDPNSLRLDPGLGLPSTRTLPAPCNFWGPWVSYSEKTDQSPIPSNR